MTGLTSGSNGGEQNEQTAFEKSEQRHQDRDEAPSRAEVRDAFGEIESRIQELEQHVAQISETAESARTETERLKGQVPTELEGTVEEIARALQQVNRNVEAVIDNTKSMSGPSRSSMSDYEEVHFSEPTGESES